MRVIQSFTSPLFNVGQALTVAVALIGTYLALQIATAEDRDMLALSWALSVQAVLYCGIGLAVWSIITVPFHLWNDERQKGRWVGSKFVYHRPELVAVSDWTWQDDGKTCKICFSDAEANSFIDYLVELDPPVGLRASCSVDHKPNLARIILGSIKSASRPGMVKAARLNGHGSCKLDGKFAYLAVSLDRDTVPVVSRVYIRAFDTEADESLIGA